MKKTIIVIIFLAIISLSGCFSRVKMLNFEYQSESKQSEEIVYSIVSAINNHDSLTLKNLFSVNARNDSESLDDDIEHLMGVYQGEIVSLDRISGHTSESNNYGVKEISISKSYIVETDSNSYLFRFEIRRNDNNIDDNGLFQLEIVKEESDQFLFWILHNDNPGIRVGNQLKPKDYVAGLLRGLEVPVPSRLIDIFSNIAKDEKRELINEIETVGEQFIGNVNFDELGNVRILSTEVFDGLIYEKVVCDVTTYTSDDEELMIYSIYLTYIPYIDESLKGGLYNVFIVEGHIDSSQIPTIGEPGIYYISHDK